MSLALATVIALFTPVTAQAKTRNITINHSFTTSTAEANKCAKKVKTGTYNITLKRGGSFYSGYLKFVAPKSKTYTITVSNLKSNDNMFANGIASTMKVSSSFPNSIVYVDIKSKGADEKHGLRIGTYTDKDFLQKRCPLKRTGKIKLSKGEVLYLYYNFSGGMNSTKLTSKLTIK
jgi:hypothetical protein